MKKIITLTILGAMILTLPLFAVDAKKNIEEEQSRKDIESKVTSLLERCSEWKLKAYHVQDQEIQDYSYEILDKAETDLVRLKKYLAKDQADGKGKLKKAYDKLGKIKHNINLLDDYYNDEIIEEQFDNLDSLELDAEKFTETKEIVRIKLLALAAEIEVVKEKIIEKEEEDKNVKVYYALLDEAKQTFYEADLDYQAALENWEKGNKERASTKLYRALFLARAGYNLIWEFDADKLKDKDKKGKKLSEYDDLVIKFNLDMEKIGELRADAYGLDNQKAINKKLDTAEKKIKKAYVELLDKGMDATKAELDQAEDYLDAARKFIEKAAGMIGDGAQEKELDEDAVNKMIKKVTFNKKKVNRRYKKKEDKMDTSEKETMEDLKEKIKSNYQVSKSFLNLEQLKQANTHSYAAYLATKTSLRLYKKIK